MRRLGEGLIERLFAPRVALLRGAVMTSEMGQLVREDLAEPGESRGFVVSLKAFPAAPGFEERLLDGVRLRKFSLKPPIDFQTREQLEPRLVAQQPLRASVIGRRRWCFGHEGIGKFRELIRKDRP